MKKLFLHLWDQLINDEEAAKVRISAAKTWLVSIGVQVLALTGGTLSSAMSWGWKEWTATLLTATIAAGAKAADPVTKAQP